MKVDSALSVNTVAAVIVRAARFHLALCLLSGAFILISQLCLCILCVFSSHVSWLSVCVVIAAECFCFSRHPHISLGLHIFRTDTVLRVHVFAFHLGRILCTGLLGLFQEYHAVVASWQDVARELQGGARQESWIWTSKLLCHGGICGEQREECNV